MFWEKEQKEISWKTSSLRFHDYGKDNIMIKCIIDCISVTDENRFFTLNLKGKPIVCHSIDTALNSGLFGEVNVLTQSDYVSETCKSYYGDKVNILRDIKEVDYPSVILSGRAPFMGVKELCEFAKLCRGDVNLFAVAKPIPHGGGNARKLCKNAFEFSS